MQWPLEWSVVALLALCVIGGVEAKVRNIGSEFVPAESGKRPNEPSCEQLRVLWRISKRQARASEVTNEIPQYRDPFVYNVWEPFPGTLRSAGARAKSIGPAMGRRQRPVYGKIVHTPPAGAARNFDSARARPFEELTARMFGSGRSGGARKTFRYTGPDGSLVPQSGSFQQLKDIVRAERARELQQRFMEDVAGSGFGQLVVSVAPPLDEDGTYGSFRYGKQEEPSRVRGGVLSFPDVLAPAAGRLGDEPSGFTSPEEAFGPAEIFEEELPPVQLSAKAAKQRSSVTKGQRVYKATARTKQPSPDSSGYPFAPDTSGEEEEEAQVEEEEEAEDVGDSAEEPDATEETPDAADSCTDASSRTCASSGDCLCVSPRPTVSRCFHATSAGPGVCQVFDLAAAESDEFGTWHATPLEASQLGAWFGQVAPSSTAPPPAPTTPTTPSNFAH